VFKLNHANPDDSQVVAIMNNAEIKCLICSTSMLPRIETIAPQVPSLTFVVVIGSMPNESTLANHGVQLLSFDDIENKVNTFSHSRLIESLNSIHIHIYFISNETGND